MGDGTGKTRVKELKVELYVDEDLLVCLQEVLDGTRDTLELHQVYFRHLVVEDLRHEGLKISHLKIPVGRIAKVKVRLSGQ
ncbi:hypothetical protein OS242_09505 [Tumebacillus sp. DT12]|uniref:CYTH domain-containing protein n=1 Tax=Tumebacillus lacus TaxID=2995335 RepID=A0ABT3WZX0_9BACL|nr:hypothetical protein [Tumebacillus lacus]MCX7570198.1 hypothetical protein [Tumebacillus lacus]